MRPAFIFIGFVLLFAACQEEVKPIINNAIGEGEIPTQESWDSKILITDDGLLKAIVYAEHIQMYEERQAEIDLKWKEIKDYQKQIFGFQALDTYGQCGH